MATSVERLRCARRGHQTFGERDLHGARARAHPGSDHASPTEPDLKRYPPTVRVFASALAAIAGFVDAVGLLMSGGYFVSFMSGNSTRMAVGFIEQAPAAILGLGLIGAFVAGVTSGAFAGRRAAQRRPAVILALVAGMLAAAAAVLTTTGAPWGLSLLAFAMGAENTVFAEDGDVRIGLTYMTGALVKLGKGVAAALEGGDRVGWAPYLLLWLGLVAGAAAGAIAFGRLGAGALWIAAGLTALAALAATRSALTALATPPHSTG